MKKITLLFSAVLIFTLSFYSCDQSQIDSVSSDDVLLKRPSTTINVDPMENPDAIQFCGRPQVEKLMIGRTRDSIGTVTISNNESSLFITIETDGFRNTPNDNNVKMWIGTQDQFNLFAPNVPDNNRPAPGHYIYKDNVAPSITKVTYEIPLSDFSVQGQDVVCPQDLYVVVHVDYEGDETAFSGDEIGNSSNGAWWWYSIFTTSCCDDPCYCSFGYDYQNTDAAEIAGIITGNKFVSIGVDSFILWSNEFKFDDLKDGYELILVANSDTKTPLDTNGDIDMAGSEVNAHKVGTVTLTTKMNGNEHVIDVEYLIDQNYVDSKIQLDLYIGADRIPGYNTGLMKIKETATNKVYQTILPDGSVSYKFENKPWIPNETGSVFITPHAAIGDCPPMPMQGDDTSNDY